MRGLILYRAYLMLCVFLLCVGVRGQSIVTNNINKSATMWLNGNVDTVYDGYIDTVYDENNNYDAVQTDTSKAPKLINGSWEFDGVDDFLTLENNINFNNNYTICGWIKFAELSDSRINIILASPSDNFTYVLGLRLKLNNNLRLWQNQPSSGYTATTVATGITTNTWYHFVFSVEERTNASFYINNNKTNLSLIDFSGDFNNGLIGKRLNNDQYFYGIIEDLKVFDRKLIDDEVQNLYNQYDTTGGVLNCNENKYMLMDADSAVVIYEQ